MKKMLCFVVLVLTTGLINAQQKPPLCEKLLSVYQSSGDEFNYARGLKNKEFSNAETGFKSMSYDLKPFLIENTDFTEGDITIYLTKDEETGKPIKLSELRIKTAYLGEVLGEPGDTALVNHFVEITRSISNCFAGATVEQTQLTSIEKYTHAYKYVLFKKKILNEQKLIDNSLSLNNPYIEISLHKTIPVNNKYKVYVGFKFIHKKEL